MTATRSTKEQYSYERHNRHNDPKKACPFCAMEKGHVQYVEETQYLKVIRNRLAYSLWDGQGVRDHLMIVPKEHTDKLGQLSPEAAVEFIKLIDRYESDGYNLYARAPVSSVKSVPHHHTHLIKLDGRTKRFLFMLRWPFYIRLTR